MGEWFKADITAYKIIQKKEKWIHSSVNVRFTDVHALSTTARFGIHVEHGLQEQLWISINLKAAMFKHKMTGHPEQHWVKNSK